MERERRTLLVKVGVKDAYLNVPFHPEDLWLTEMVLTESLFVGVTLPFGLQSVSNIFTALADAAEWMMQGRGGLRHLLP